MLLRRYRPADCETLADVFHASVHAIDEADYSVAQLDAWASGSVDLEKWNASFLDHFTVVAEVDGVVAGFGDVDETGYLDRLFVHPEYQRRGIASAICDALEASVSETVSAITVNASITACGFFERRDYTVVRRQEVRRNGETLVNYAMMRKNLRPFFSLELRWSHERIERTLRGRASGSHVRWRC